MQNLSPNEEKKTSRRKNWLNDYARLSSLGIQLAVISGLLAYGGYKLDEYLKNKTPWFTMLGTLLGVGGGLYYAVKQFLKK